MQPFENIARLTDETLRYLGYTIPADERILTMISALAAEFKAYANPSSVYRVSEGNNSPDFLAKHLTDCDKAVILAATLGTRTDLLLRRLNVRNMEQAAVAEALCAAAIEDYLDQIQEKIRAEFFGSCFVRRFSPGYGDFDITCQREILDFLDCRKRMGLFMTEGFMLVPSKSVTAVITKDKTKDKTRINKKCQNCSLRQCKFRFEEL